MNSAEVTEGSVPVVDREHEDFSGTVKELLEERGRGRTTEWLDDTLGVYSRYVEAATTYIDDRVNAMEYDAALYGLSRLWEMGDTKRLVRKVGYLQHILKGAREEGDEETVVLARAFAEQAGLRIPMAERTPLFWPDAITDLIDERGHAERQEWLDGWLGEWPGDRTYLTVHFPVRERRGRRHDTILYAAYRLDKLARERDWWDRERVVGRAVASTIKDAEADGDHEVAELTRRFADWAGVEIPDERTTR